MQSPVTVACVQAEPVILDRAATLAKLADLDGRGGAQRARSSSSSPRRSSPPTRRRPGRRRSQAGPTRARRRRSPCSPASRSRCPGPTATASARSPAQHGVWLVTGVNEFDPARPGTLYNSLLYHAPDGSLAQHHRKLVPTNHERLIWGQGDGGGLEAIDTSVGRLGGLICWENYMPLARFSLYASGVEIYIASTADDGDAWQATLVHIARESRAFVVAPSHFQRAGVVSRPTSRSPTRSPAWTCIGRGGSAILGPDGAYLAGPLYGEEGILYAELDPARLAEERQRFDPAGHYHRPDVLQLTVTPRPRV